MREPGDPAAVFTRKRRKCWTPDSDSVASCPASQDGYPSKGERLHQGQGGAAYCPKEQSLDGILQCVLLDRASPDFLQQLITKAFRHQQQCSRQLWPYLQTSSMMSQHLAFAAGLQSLVCSLDDSTGSQRLQISAKMRTTMAVVRHVMQRAGAEPAKSAGISAFLNEMAEHNVLQEWSTVLQTHVQMLQGAGLTINQRCALAKVAHESCRSADSIAADSRHLVAELHQELQADRPVMQQDALQIRQTQTMLNKLGALQQLARQARLATWSCILGCEELEPHQAARLQLSPDPSILPDMLLMARILSHTSQPALPPRRLWLFDEQYNQPSAFQASAPPQCSPFSLPDLQLPLSEGQSSLDLDVQRSLSDRGCTYPHVSAAAGPELHSIADWAGQHAVQALVSRPAQPEAAQQLAAATSAGSLVESAEDNKESFNTVNISMASVADSSNVMVKPLLCQRAHSW